MKLISITIKRFRSINNLTVDIENKIPLIVCGSNNVGKTNFLRALDLYFSLDKNKFDREKDIPYDIAEGRSTGGRYNTTIKGKFTDEKNNKYEITSVFGWKKDEGNFLVITGNKNRNNMAENDLKKIIKNFRFLLIEASNIHIPEIIAEVIDEEVLPLGLDTLRRRQTEPLKKLNIFIEASKESVKNIEKEIGKNFNDFVADIQGIDNKDWKIEILFAEYNKLREALSGLIDFTLYDRSKRKMESKGSGIQRIVLLSLMKYIADRSKKKIIWGIDEPEAFLQPSLQKRTFNILKNLSVKQDIYFTTHSQHFVDIENVKNTYLFEATYEEKEYARKRGEIFYKVNTFVNNNYKNFEKIQRVKQHLGILRNDSWEVMPYNILVEGEEDKIYFTTLMKKFGFEVPNILIAGGTSKIKGYLQFLLEFCEEIDFIPEIACILDHDSDGKKTYDSLSKAIGKNKYNKINLTISNIPRCDGLKDNTLILHENVLIASNQ